MIREHLKSVNNAGTPTTVCVVLLLAKRVQVSPHKRSEVGIALFAQMGLNYARMEVEGQPCHECSVDIQLRWCPCHYCFAFGVCGHVVFALRTTEHVDSRGKSILENRSKRKRHGPYTETQGGGRPALAGPALRFQ
jgi:hypothetical protein